MAKLPNHQGDQRPGFLWLLLGEALLLGVAQVGVGGGGGALGVTRGVGVGPAGTGHIT